VQKAKLYKKTLVIGHLPEKMILAFFDFFLKNMPFYDKNRKIEKVQIVDDHTSLLNQKKLIIEFKKEYVFS
jgi:hypothetical protein